MADINNMILDALNEGYAPQDIFNHLKNSDNPEHQNWYAQYTANMADRGNEPAAGGSSSEPNVGTLEAISNLSPAQKALGAAALLGGTAAVGAGAYYGKRQIDVNAAVKEQALKNQLPPSPGDLEFKRQNDIAERKAAIEERRLAGENVAPEMSEADKIKLEREKLRLEAEQKKLAYEEQVRQHNIAKMAREQADAEAKQAQQAAKAKQVGGGTLTESEMKMLSASETAKISKAVIADQKAQAAKAAVPAVAPQAPVAPPVEPSATVQLTPSPQVSAEAVPESSFAGAQELKTGTGKPAFQGMNPEGKLHKSYSSIKDVPANMAFVPGAQYVDVLRNDLSQPTYTEQFRTKDWPSVYEQAIEEAKGINRSLGRETRAALLAKGVPKEELPKPTEGIFQKIGGKHGSKSVRVGGVVGALTLIPNLVKAQSLGEAADIVSDVAVPPFAESREAGMKKSEEEKLLASKFKEAAKLGSPYRSVPPPKR